MPRVLNRPMFKRGGNTSTNTGIISGFENGGAVRQNYARGDYVDTISGFLEEPQYQQGLTKGDWYRIAAAGMEIMGATPTGKGGFTGALQAASPALASMGKDLAGTQDSRYSKYLESRRAHNEVLASAALEEIKSKQEQEHKMKLLKEEGSIQSGLVAQQGIVDLALISDQGGVDLQKIKEQSLEDIKRIETQEGARGTQDRLTNKERKYEIDTMFKYYQDAANDWSNIMSQIDALDSTDTDYQVKLKDLEMKKSEAVYRMRSAFQSKTPNGVVIGDYIMMGLKDTATKLAMAELGYTEEPDIQDIGFDTYKIYLDAVNKHLRDVVRSHRDASAADNIESFRQGGRVGYANGTDPYMQQPINNGAGITQETQGFSEGQNPMQPAQTQPAQANSSPISYEELRARLPMEVSDDVVRLLATSEQALIDFAQIETQDDIARFNQKYNSDLMLPTQQAV